MPIATYEQALDFWHNRVNYEQRGMPADLRELKLERMRALLDRLGNPHDQLRIVHIAGSKGKGSTAAMLANVLRHAGLRTGLFTSPHLCRVEERVQINGQPISQWELTELMREIEPIVLELEALDSPPTFFEIVTALGFLHFARRQVDIAVIEVGLGGRFDSTSVCRPLLSLITSISLDHTQQLGDTLASIAREKAGIIKPGIRVLHAVEQDEARDVIDEVASATGSPVRALNTDFCYDSTPGWIDAQTTRLSRVTVTTTRRVWPTFELGLLGEHQARNAALAVAALSDLHQQGFPIIDEVVASGLRTVHWPARLEVVSRRPMVILDCAHNTASVQALVDALKTSFAPARRTLIFAASADKDLRGMLELLRPHFDQAVFTRYTSSLRGANPEGLVGLWRELGCRNCAMEATPSGAWQAARAGAREEDMIVITGSVFLAGEVRQLLMK